MRRTVLRAIAVMLMSLLIASPALALDRARHSAVVIMLAPYLQWDDIAEGRAPTIAALCERAAVANASVRNGAADPHPDGLFGAGVLSAMRPLSTTEARRIVLAAPFGALGDAVAEAGGRTVAISGATPVGGEEGAEPVPALVVASGSGHHAREGTGSPDLVTVRTDTSSGPTVDLPALEEAFLEAMEAPRPSLVVIDPGDLERARTAAQNGDAWEEGRRSAVRVTDHAVARVLRSLPKDAALIIVSTAAYRADGPAGFGPVLVLGEGPGVLESDATRRTGVVTLADVGATALGLIGIDAPPGAAGVPLAVDRDERESAARIDDLSDLDVRARALEALREPVWFGFLGICVLVIIASLAIWWFTAEGRTPLLRRVASWALIVVLAVPPGSLMALVGAVPRTVAGAWVGLAVGTLAVLALVLAWPRRDPVHTLGRLLFLTLGILALDQLTGGYLSNGTAFSYSALFGVRFYGLGNEGAAVGFGALLAGVGWRVDQYGADRARGFIIAGAAAVLVAALPSLGANMGVAAWGVVAVTAGYLWASRRRLTWPIVLGAVSAIGVVIAVAVWLDLGGRPSHLGGFATTLAGDPSAAVAMLVRKLEISMRAVRATPLVALMPIILGAMGYQLLRPSGAVGGVLASHRGVAATWAGTVAGALTAVFTEDSAVAIGALLMLYALVVFGVVTLSDHAEDEESR